MRICGLQGGGGFASIIIYRFRVSCKCLKIYRIVDYISDYLLDGSNKRHNIDFIIWKCKDEAIYPLVMGILHGTHTSKKYFWSLNHALTRDTSKYKICSEFSSANVWILSIWRVWIRNLNIVSWLIRRWYLHYFTVVTSKELLHLVLIQSISLIRAAKFTFSFKR